MTGKWALRIKAQTNQLVEAGPSRAAGKWIRIRCGKFESGQWHTRSVLLSITEAISFRQALSLAIREANK